MSDFDPTVIVWARMWRRQRRDWPFTLVAAVGGFAIWSTTRGAWPTWASVGACLALGVAVGLVQFRRLR